MSLLLDSHTLIWFLEDNPKLSAAAANALDDASRPWFVSVISVAEAIHVVRKTQSAVSETELLTFVERSGRVRVVSATYSIVRAATLLDGLDGIHDEIIFATAQAILVNRPTLQLVTRDRLIRASNLVPTLW